jgi:hypothetical protein
MIFTGTDAALNDILLATFNVLAKSPYDIYDIDLLIEVLTGNGYSVQKIKEKRRYFPKDSIVVKVSGECLPCQTLKIHPDTYITARHYYEDCSVLRELAASGYAAKVNFTSDICSKFDDDRLRIVLYDFLDGPPLEQLPQNKAARMRNECILGLQSAGFNGFSVGFGDIIYLRSEKKGVLTDFDKILKEH